MKKIRLISLFFIISSVINAQNDIGRIENLIVAERYENALDSLLFLKKTDPQNPYVYFSLGEVVLKSYMSDPFSDSKSNVIKKSVGYFNEGVNAGNLNPLNYVGLGIIELFQNSDTAKADIHFNKALSLIPKKKRKIDDLHIKTYIELATAELYSSKPRLYKSEAYINRLKELRPDLPAIYIAYGDIMMSQSKASEAIANYKKALYLKNEPLTNVLIGKIYALARNLQESKKYYDNAIQLDSMFAPVYKGLGDLYYLSGQNKIAKDYYAKFLRLTGNNIPAKIDYAKALFKAKDYNEALKVTSEVLKADSSKLFLYRIAAYSAFDKEPPDLNSAYTSIEKLFNKAKPEELISRDYLYYGRILLAVKKDTSDIQKGLNMLETAYQADSTNAKLLIEIINQAYVNKEFNTAIKYLKLRIQNGDTATNSAMLLGRMFYQSKLYEKADSVFATITAKNPGNIEANVWRGYISSIKDPDMKQGLSKPYFEKVAENATSDTEKYAKELTEAYSYLGSYFLFSDNPNTDKAIDFFNRLIGLNPENKDLLVKAYYSLAIAYTKKKEYVKAKEYYQRILKINPDDQNAKSGLRAINKYLKAVK